MVGEAFHTYFKVSDISNVHVKGLEDALYSDKVFAYERRVEKNDVRFNGEFDRVYLNTTADCMIAVSYTHLDVYKRQTVHRAPRAIPRDQSLDRNVGVVPQSAVFQESVDGALCL